MIPLDKGSEKGLLYELEKIYPQIAKQRKQALKEKNENVIES
jgi:hypothetical protein